MTLISRIVSRMMGLSPAETYDIALEKDIAIPMSDGVILYADHYSPGNLGERPTVLVRSPYGRKVPFGFILGRLIAERGFHVLIQSCRGTADSEGDFNPFHQERADGLATVAWLKQQAWYNGEVATCGPSYLGLVQWAIASEISPDLKAMSTWITSAEFRSITYPSEALFFESALGWSTMMYQTRHGAGGLFYQLFSANRKLEAGYEHLPLDEVDRIVTGNQIPYWQDWMQHELPGDEWWADCDFSQQVSEVKAPNFMIGGWYDIFLSQTFRDYQALIDAGQQAEVTIGPWAHTNLKLMIHALRGTITWLRKTLLNTDKGATDLPIHLYIMGADEWRDFAVWPPENAQLQPWYLHAHGGLSPDSPSESDPDRYRYDPADPTPNIGGAGLGRVTGPKDNRKLEARADVLVYTSAVLQSDVEAIGPVSAELYVQSSLKHADFFARLCDLDPSGKSTNICDGLVRLVPESFEGNENAVLRVKIELWPTAYCFKRGHRIRLQVSSGAFPRWVRNTGSGERLGKATQLFVADQTVFHDAAHPSALILPIVARN